MPIVRRDLVMKINHLLFELLIDMVSILWSAHFCIYTHKYHLMATPFRISYIKMHGNIEGTNLILSDIG